MLTKYRDFVFWRTPTAPALQRLAELSAGDYMGDLGESEEGRRIYISTVVISLPELYITVIALLALVPCYLLSLFQVCFSGDRAQSPPCRGAPLLADRAAAGARLTPNPGATLPS